MNEGIRYLKIKIKHLAAEARIIREEERKTHAYDKWKLQHHRRSVVREAARTTQLAYAFLRGKPLDVVAKGYKPLHGNTYGPNTQDVDDVKRMVIKYGNPSQRRNCDQLVDEWFK